jgi:glycine/D-amino acid oxidase-like deaminating enzyme
MRRRSFLATGAAAAALGATGYFELERLPVTVNYPGRAAGHRLRDGLSRQNPPNAGQFDVIVVGSGLAGLTAVWKLAKEGVRNIALIEGPEAYGNAASASDFGITYPTGAHYLPLPSMESMHMREMLSDFRIILEDPFAERPTYDERYLLHAPADRVLYQGVWQDGYLPTELVAASERDQHARFFKAIDGFSAARGADGRRGFTVPIELASDDPQFRQLDQLSFSAWLDQNGFFSETLRWYLNYCCRDDYGRLASEVSAFAGLHYFAARGGEASNAERGAVITFPAGLGALAARLEQASDLKRGHLFHAMATSIRKNGNQVDVQCVQLDASARFEAMSLSAPCVVVAMPLFVAMHVVERIEQLGFSRPHLPTYSPWMVSNFILNAFPGEKDGSALAWDNVVYGARDLGYVVSTHQDIRQSRPEHTSFTAYSALAEMDAGKARRWLDQATTGQLLERASTELREAYGWRLGPCVEEVQITVRGHAMASPTPGYRSNAGLLALRQQSGPIQFAHSDLSCYSVCEEAAWWGYRAAGRIAKTLKR